MMPTFPPPPLKFRTVGSPQYGFKASLSDRACPRAAEVKPTPGIPSNLTWFTSALRADHRYTTFKSRRIALSGSPEQPSPRATPLNPTGPSLRKGYVVPSFFATTTRSASLAGTHGLHGFLSAYTAGLRWAGAPEATDETFPTFPAVPSTRAADLTPVSPRRPPVNPWRRDSRLPRSVTESPLTTPPLPAIPDGGQLSTLHRSLHAAARVFAQPSWLATTRCRQISNTSPSEVLCHSRF
jgi:hypothetical protein